ncbi:MAG: hydroxyectoine utilization dehydratase EutB [Spirochaetes bacterium]|nr:MAG: hydroxyectoine utilization dehydratase EutB [Spirochaetota bacterium]
MKEITINDVLRARKKIAGYVLRTPLVVSHKLRERTGADVYFKLESLQKTGSFKVRGAANKILSLTEDEKSRGVITFSTGNHGKAVAYMAGRLGIDATVCLSEHVPAYRAEAIRELGAQLSIRGKSQDEAEDNYHRITREKGMIPVVPFDDPFIIAGQGTVGVEMMEDDPEIDTVLVPLSGGGLLSGVALAVKSLNPSARVVGVSVERSKVMLESLKRGKPVQMEEQDTLADSLLGGIGTSNKYTLAMVRQYTDDHVVISEEEIKDGMYYALKNHGLVVEGAAAVGISALLHGKLKVREKKIAVVVSGSTVYLPQYLAVINEKLKKDIT